MSITEHITVSSTTLKDRATKVFPGGVTRSTLYVAPHPPYAARGNGAYVTDTTGHGVIDCNNNYTALIHGHNNPEITAAATEVMHSGTAFGLPTASEVDFAELLSARVGLPTWRFCNSGTEAVMMAIRAARAFTGRDLLVRFEGSYHGTADAVVAPESRGIPKGTAFDVVVLPKADSAAFTELMRQRGSEVAAVLIDLMPNRAGLVPATQEFAELVRGTTTKHGALMIVDEVITLRLGTGGLHHKYSITPDLLTAGKIIGGGFPVGAIAGSAHILSPFSPLEDRPVGWGGTFSANPVTMRAGKRAMELLDQAAIERVNALGEALRQELVAAKVNATGHGSLTRLHHSQGAELWWKLYEKGVLVGTNGLIALSTPMDETDVARVMEAVISSYKELK